MDAVWINKSTTNYLYTWCSFVTFLWWRVTTMLASIPPECCGMKCCSFQVECVLIRKRHPYYSQYRQFCVDYRTVCTLHTANQSMILVISTCFYAALWNTTLLYLQLEWNAYMTIRLKNKNVKVWLHSDVALEKARGSAVSRPPPLGTTGQVLHPAQSGVRCKCHY